MRKEKATRPTKNQETHRIFKNSNRPFIYISLITTFNEMKINFLGKGLHIAKRISINNRTMKEKVDVNKENTARLQ